MVYLLNIIYRKMSMSATTIPNIVFYLSISSTFTETISLCQYITAGQHLSNGVISCSWEFSYITAHAGFWLFCCLSSIWSANCSFYRLFLFFARSNCYIRVYNVYATHIYLLCKTLFSPSFKLSRNDATPLSPLPRKVPQ